MDRGCKHYRNHVRMRAYVSDGESCDSNVVIDEHTFDEEKAYKALTRFLCHASVPPRLVKEESFKHYVKLVNPCFNVQYDTVIHQVLEFHKEENENERDFEKFVRTN
ncbi:hypothetical protein Fot_54509 [Forsythia ovata]|uniref:Uncharacterized protein n=1 Tax=Forsythia ovata TaxID=205694 RepID=A0ABD1P7B5_9LAMI